MLKIRAAIPQSLSNFVEHLSQPLASLIKFLPPYMVSNPHFEVIFAHLDV